MSVSVENGFLVQRSPLVVVHEERIVGESDHTATGGYRVGHAILGDERKNGFYVTRFFETAGGDRTYQHLNPAKTLKLARAMFRDMVACQIDYDSAERAARLAKAA